MHPDFCIAKPPLYIVPAIHYTMESSALVRQAFCKLSPDCVAVELPESLQKEFFHAASRLPDLSAITCDDLIFPCEPCDASFEALRSAQDAHIPAFCIDLDVEGYPKIQEPLPDPYSIFRIGLKTYYEAYEGCLRADPVIRSELDMKRELYMARRLRELSFSYDKILVVLGMSHVRNILHHLKDSSYPPYAHVERKEVSVVTYTEERVREVLAECGYITNAYEHFREKPETLPDRQEILWELLKRAQSLYEEKIHVPLRPQSLELTLKFATKWARLQDGLLPNLFQLITASKGCVDHNFAYEVWKLATEYPHYKNIDSLPEKDLGIDEVWGGRQSIHFHLKKPSDKGLFMRRLKKDRQGTIRYPPNPFSLCSYSPEDSVIEDFGLYLKQRAYKEQIEEQARTIPFSNSLEDGIDVKETIRHWPEKRLYVKTRGKPPGLAGSCVIIFDEDIPEPDTKEKFPALMTWLGEHEQESDMAFYATPMSQDIVGPGISRCTFGGFMLSYPSRRLFDIWSDPDYREFPHKHEIMLAAACDYSMRPVIVYVAEKPPENRLKQYASRQGKRIFYIPLSQFPQRVIQKLRTFHILDGQDKRNIADEYIY